MFKRAEYKINSYKKRVFKLHDNQTRNAPPCVTSTKGVSFLKYSNSLKSCLRCCNERLVCCNNHMGNLNEYIHAYSNRCTSCPSMCCDWRTSEVWLTYRPYKNFCRAWFNHQLFLRHGTFHLSLALQLQQYDKKECPMATSYKQSCSNAVKPTSAHLVLWHTIGPRVYFTACVWRAQAPQGHALAHV